LDINQNSLKETEMTKYQIWRIQLLRGFFEALHKNQLQEFLKSDDITSFLRAAKTDGLFGGKIPDGDTGSKFPGTGSKDPLDVLHGLFHGVGSNLGTIDHPGDVDPASDRDDGNMTIEDKPDGTIITTVTHPDGRVETWTTDERGGYQYSSRGGADDKEITTRITPDDNGKGFTVTEGYHLHDGRSSSRSTHYELDGGHSSPGEDGGGDTNGVRNPLSGVETLGPQSMQQMLSAIQHPATDSGKIDPNSGKDDFKLTEADKEKLGLTAAGADVLDPNSGLDPLTQLNLDPNKMNTGSKNDDELDRKNTGLKPVPIHPNVVK
jgi:hypothetical protein